LEVITMRAVAVTAALALTLAGLAAGASAQTSGETLILQRITAVYGASFEPLVQQMRADGLGWGEIIMVLHLALHLATVSGKTVDESVDEIRDMRDKGMGYGEIARALGIHPGELGKAVAAVMSEGRSTEGLQQAAAARERARGRP
jgi:hypothetical protein